MGEIMVRKGIIIAAGVGIAVGAYLILSLFCYRYIREEDIR